MDVNSFIRLDAKSRLVLPLLLRDRLGIRNGGPKGKVVSIKIVSVAKDCALVELSKPNANKEAEARLYSKNGSEVKGN